MFGRKSSTYKSWKRDWEKFSSIPEELDIVNLGSSGEDNNFDYTLWPEKGANFACTPQDIFYDYQILKAFGNRIKKGGIVLICLSEFALVVDKYKAEHQNYKYYGILEKKQICNYSELKRFLIRHFPGVVYRDLVRQEIKAFVKKILKRDSKSNNNLEKISQKAMDGWMHEFGWDTNPTVTKSQKDALERSWSIICDEIKYCKSYQLIPIIIIPPFNQHLMKIMPEELIDVCLWKYIQRLKDMSIRVISFWDDKEMQADKYYDSSIRLNNLGKYVFNEKVRERIYEGL